MKNKNTISYLFMILGVIFLMLYSLGDFQPKQLFLLVGLTALIIGIYILGRNLPPKKEIDYQDTWKKNLHREND